MCQYADDFDTHARDVWNLLATCREHRITLNASKMQLFVKKAQFAGFILSDEGVAVDPSKVEAISKFPRPTNITQLRSFMGMVAQLGDFSSEISAKANPLRPLLRSNTPFEWNNDHENAFEETKPHGHIRSESRDCLADGCIKKKRSWICFTPKTRRSMEAHPMRITIYHGDRS